MEPIKPLDIEIETRKEIEIKQDGSRSEVAVVRVGTEDIIAIVGGLIAIGFAIAMLAGFIPINAYTAGIVGLSGVSAGAAKIIRARGTKK